MRNIRLRNLLLFSTSTALLLGWLTTSGGLAPESIDRVLVFILQDENQISPSPVNIPTLSATSTPDATSAIILPIIQQDASNQTAETPGKQTPLPTITPTPIPPQSTSINVPIVFGAIVIVIIIILAWLIISQRFFGKKD